MNLVGGTLSIRSKPGQGTTVEANVALPVAK
jgi:signal transduction histidine kinase